MFGPTFVQVPVGAEWVAPFASVNVKSTSSPAAATKPFPSPTSFNSVTVNVCDWPTRFVAADGVIEIFASTNVFVAGAEFPPVPFVLRVKVRPATVGEAEADTTVTPVVFEESVIVQLPVPPDVVHGFAEVKLPGPDTMEKLIDVPSGAFTKPVPSFTFTCAVNVCVWPTRLVAVAGVIWMFASTTRNGSHGPSEGRYALALPR